MARSFGAGDLLRERRDGIADAGVSHPVVQEPCAGERRQSFGKADPVDVTLQHVGRGEREGLGATGNRRTGLVGVEKDLSELVEGEGFEWSGLEPVA